VMQIAQVLAGYSLADADLLRRAMGKKKPEEMALQREVFVKGATERGVDERQADHIFGLMEKFAGYGFNKPHSVAYALIAYQTAWLKHYYPAHFMAAVLSADMQTTDKIVVNIEECREMNLEILPPDVNQGEYRFVADQAGRIVYGLGAIKGMGEGPADDIVRAREIGGPFNDLYDLCERVDQRKVNKRAIEALIGAGALDGLVEDSLVCGNDPVGYRRALLHANHEDAVKLAEQKARNQDSGHTDLFGDDMLIVDGHRYNHFDGLQVLSFKERLQWEKDTLGLYLTGHPIDVYKAELQHIHRTRIVDLRAGKDEQTIVGLVVGMRTMKSKKGETIAFATLDDRTGRTEVSVFSDLYETHHGKLEKDAVLMIKGAASVDDFTGGIRLRASEIMDLAEARERSIKRLKLSLDDQGLSGDFTGELAALLSPFCGAPGEGCPVAISYLRSDAQVEVLLGENWRVQPAEDLIQNLRDHYGSDHVQLDYR
ncbi:MAG TPA: OB-fold nucleic acid binding domain-containing protein, partial [Pseudomonadales bacterium]|nr:OB-fold nucleic acid binding domain-containing protein [Pseudomonadales bacterium]